MKRVCALLMVVAVLAALMAGCGHAETEAATTKASKTPTATPTITYPEYEQVIRDYWAAFNNFDLEKCVSYLEPEYAERRRAGIQSELDEFQMGKVIGVKMVVAEVSEPVTMEDGQLEVKVTMKISPRGLSDDRYLLYYLVAVDGALKITRQTDDPDKTPPGRAPQNLSAEVIAASQVKLVWEEKSSRETGVLLERATDRYFRADLVSFTLPADSVTYTDTEVVAGATYYYRAFDFNQAGNSDSSNIIKVIIPAA